jgi:hypothetical protein
MNGKERILTALAVRQPLYIHGINEAPIIGIGRHLTPMQAYAERTFEYLVDWVENGELPPDSKLVETDPANDITAPIFLDW